jgi:chorismate synthase
VKQSATETTFKRNGLSPAAAGYTLDRDRWTKEIAGIGLVAIEQLDWRHSQAASYAGYREDRRDLDALAFLVELQRHTWGMSPEDLVPVNVLAVVADTGGAIFVAYDPRLGFNADGWLGFIFGLGARNGELVSHMLGVRPEARGAAGLGWALKLAQADAARQSGHHAMNWTFDPMRGGNARLNLEKLGAVIEEMTIDKYGVLTTELYGAVPSDRVIAHWDLESNFAIQKVQAAGRGEASSRLQDALALPVLTVESVNNLIATKPPRIAYEIPGDIDDLMRVDARRAVTWRSETRALLSRLVTTNRAVPIDGDLNPTAIAIETTQGDYVIDGFASGAAESGRRSFYLLTRKGIA